MALPQSQPTLSDAFLLEPELHGVHTGGRKATVPDAEGDPYYFQRVCTKCDLPRRRFKDPLPAFRQVADDLPFTFPVPVGEGEKNAELAMEIRVRWNVERVKITDQAQDRKPPSVGAIQSPILA
jgi:hypothetical protein